MKYCLALFLLFTTACSTEMQSGRDGLASICAIAQSPGQFAGKIVRVRGLASTDYLEFSGIEDLSCPHRIIEFGHEPSTSRSLEQARSLIDSIRGQPGRRVEMTVEGMFEWHEGQVPAWVIQPQQAFDYHLVSSQ